VAVPFVATLSQAGPLTDVLITADSVTPGAGQVQVKIAGDPPAFSVVGAENDSVTGRPLDQYSLTFRGAFPVRIEVVSELATQNQTPLAVNFDNLTVNAPSGAAFSLVRNANVQLSLKGASVLSSGSHAGLQVAVSAKGTARAGIESTTGGSLTATGGPGSAGIGAPAGNGTEPSADAGIIEIGGNAVVTATGGSRNADKPGAEGGAGIGGACEGKGGTVTISGNAVVNATGGGGAAGIGGGNSGSTGGKITIGGSATVTATGGTTRGAGIGGGLYGSGGAIAILDHAKVVAVSPNSGNGIGGGYNSGMGKILISGNASVFATGSGGGAGIGGSGVYQADPTDYVKITGWPTVVAVGMTGIGGAPQIPTELLPGSITIESGFVVARGQGPDRYSVGGIQGGVTITGGSVYPSNVSKGTSGVQDPVGANGTPVYPLYIPAYEGGTDLTNLLLTTPDFAYDQHTITAPQRQWIADNLALVVDASVVLYPLPAAVPATGADAAALAATVWTPKGELRGVDLRGTKGFAADITDTKAHPVGPYGPSLMKNVLRLRAVNVKVTADGVANTRTSTKLTLTFDRAVKDLKASQVTVTNKTAAVVTNPAGWTSNADFTVWTLPLASVTAAGTVTVGIGGLPPAFDGYSVTGVPTDVQIHLKTDVKVNFNLHAPDGAQADLSGWPVTKTGQLGQKVPAVGKDVPVLVGYTFIGWFTQAHDPGQADPANAWNFGTGVITFEMVSSGGEVNFYGAWAPASTVVSFDLHQPDGCVLSPDSIAPATVSRWSKLVDAPGYKTVPVCEGYEFRGWFRDAEYASAVDESSLADAAEVVLHAKWTELGPVGYNVEHYLLNGAGAENLVASSQESGRIGAKVTATPGTYAGYEFDSSSSTAEGVIRADGSLTLKLYYRPVELLVVFNAAGGTGGGTAMATYGELAPTWADPSREGHAFAGWSSSKVEVWDFAKDVLTVANGVDLSASPGRLELTASWVAGPTVTGETTATVPEGGVRDFALTVVSEAGIDRAEVTGVPTGATVKASPDGKVRFSAGTLPGGTYNFTVVFIDRLEQKSSPVVFTVKVQAAPAGAGRHFVLEDDQVIHWFDPFDDITAGTNLGALTDKSFTSPARGTLAVDGSRLKYTPETGFAGKVPGIVTVVICDDLEQCLKLEYTFEIAKLHIVYAEPIARGASGIVGVGGTVELLGQVSPDTVNGVTITSAAVATKDTWVSDASISPTTSGKVKFGAGSLAPGTYEFDVLYTDSRGRTVTAAYSVLVVAAPVVTGDTLDRIGIDDVSELKMDVSSGAGVDRAEAKGVPDGTVVSAGIDGLVRFDPNGSPEGEYKFSVVFTDTLGQSQEVGFTIIVQAPPQGGEVRAKVAVDGEVTFTVEPIVVSRYGQLADRQITSAPDEGTATLDPVHYDATGAVPGEHPFIVMYTDDLGQTGVVRYVPLVQAPPVGTGRSFELEDDKTTLVVDVMADVAGTELQALNAGSLTQPEQGTIGLASDDAVVYTPRLGYWGDDSFQVRVCDDLGQCVALTYFVTIKESGSSAPPPPPSGGGEPPSDGQTPAGTGTGTGGGLPLTGAESAGLAGAALVLVLGGMWLIVWGPARRRSLQASGQHLR
jgi:hypothetical protein